MEVRRREDRGELGVGGRKKCIIILEKERTGPQLEDSVACALGLYDPASPGVKLDCLL